MYSVLAFFDELGDHFGAAGIHLFSECIKASLRGSRPALDAVAWLAEP